jgi:hypothetical protein
VRVVAAVVAARAVGSGSFGAPHAWPLPGRSHILNRLTGTGVTQVDPSQNIPVHDEKRPAQLTKTPRSPARARCGHRACLPTAGTRRVSSRCRWAPAGIWGRGRSQGWAAWPTCCQRAVCPRSRTSPGWACDSRRPSESPASWPQSQGCGQMQHVSVRRCTVRRHEGTRRGARVTRTDGVGSSLRRRPLHRQFFPTRTRLTLENSGQKKLRSNWGGEEKGRPPSESVSVAGHSR